MHVGRLRWLISPVGKLPEPTFLHVFDDGVDVAAMEFLPDQTRALRFAGWSDAERFAREHRLGDVAIVAHWAADLVAPAFHAFDRFAVT